MVGELSHGSFWDRDEGIPEALTGGGPGGRKVPHSVCKAEGWRGSGYGRSLCMRGGSWGCLRPLQAQS